MRSICKLLFVVCGFNFLAILVLQWQSPDLLVNTVLEDSEMMNHDEPRLDLSTALSDSRHMFKSLMFVFTGSSWSQLSASRLLCLGSQTSVDRLHELPELVNNWSGPVSIAVFAPDRELGIAVKYIQYLRSCHPAIDQQVSFHLLYPHEYPGQLNMRDYDEIAVDCQNPREVLQSMLISRGERMMQWRETYRYPQNHLRNVVKRACQTNFTYILDIDMIPNPEMSDQLETFLSHDQVSRQCVKCAFVTPTYEIEDDISHLPRNKSELIHLIKADKARPFHIEFFHLNQLSSNLSRWQQLPDSRDLEAAYKVNNYIFNYEPLYIARSDAPAFDERFIGFGMDRNSQVYEMIVAGYSFYVLNSAFTSHRGYQHLSSRPAWRALQQEENNARFDDFAREISARYNSDPLGMLTQGLKMLNLKKRKVSYDN